MRLGGKLGAVTALLCTLGCSGSQPEPGRVGPRPAPGANRDAVPPNAPTRAELRVTLYGIGPVRAGMSVAEAAAALGASLVVPDGADAATCSYLRWAGGPEGVAVMVEDARIARVEVRSGTMATDEGARIGDSAERIQRLYAGRVTASRHKYTDGQYLTVSPASPGDGAFRLVFETDAGRVTRFRSGKLPQVEYVEGCS